MNDGYHIAYPYNATATMDFVNAGTLTKNGGVTLLGHNNGTFNLTNTGTIDVASGELQLLYDVANELGGSIVQGDGTTLTQQLGTTTLNGTLEHGSNSVLQLQGATLTVPAGKQLTDMGKVVVSGSTLVLEESHTFANLEVISGSTLDARSALSIDEFKLSGTVLSSEDLTVTGTLDWDSGVMTGEGTTIIETGADAIFNASELYLREGRNFHNKGTVTQSGMARVRADTAGATTTITNAAGAQWTSNMNDGYHIAYPYNATATMDFVNAGTLTKNGGVLQRDGDDGLRQRGHADQERRGGDPRAQQWDVQPDKHRDNRSAQRRTALTKRRDVRFEW
jgi:hypothetical protein